MAKVLVIDDDELVCRTVIRVLETENHAVEAAYSFKGGVELLGKANFDLLFLDLHLPDCEGDQVIDELLSNDKLLQIIIITGDLSIERAVNAMKAGAVDYITKPFGREAILHVTNQVIKERRAKIQAEASERDPLFSLGADNRLLGTSKKMCNVNLILNKVANTPNTPVLIMGESGSGKELAAQAIHNNSTRRDSPMVKINCAAIPRPLIESELFGHEAGAFTDARNSRKGMFELADGGTIFLDEIGELDISVQPKLLRVLEDHTVTRVGGGTARPVDIRVVAATNRDLQRMCQEGSFRKDLYFRLAVMTVRMPPLRDHKEDIESLANNFLREKSIELGRKMIGYSDTVIKFFRHYSWPGNVRELKNMVERLIILSEGKYIHFEERHLRRLAFMDMDDDLSSSSMMEPARSGGSSSDDYEPQDSTTKPSMSDGPVSIEFGSKDSIMSLAELERVAIVEALDTCGGNKTVCSQRLGISRSTLQRKISQYEIQTEPTEEDSLSTQSSNF